MEIKSKNIHQEERKGKNSLFVTLDEDFNVPDTKPDMEYILRQWGEVHQELIRCEDGKVGVSARLDFAVMYQGARLDNLNGGIDINEKVNVDGITADAKPACNLKLEDLTIKMIHSRKISVKAVVEIEIVWEELCDYQIGSEVDNEGQVQVLGENIDIAQLKVITNDSIRVKEEIAIPGGKPNIGRILWKEINLCHVEDRMQEEGVRISGEIKSFIIYEADNDEGTISWLEAATSFDSTVAVSGITSDMIGKVKAVLESANIDIKTDSDGEARLFVLEAIVGVSIKAYEEVSLPIIKDLYVPLKDVTLVKTPLKLRKLAMKNNSRCRCSKRSKINSMSSKDGSILSICNVSGDVRVQMVSRVEDGIEVNGLVDAKVFFVTANDGMPWESVSVTFPFSHVIECRNMSEKCIFEVEGRLEDISCMMVGTDEIEFKALISLNAICFDQVLIESLESAQVVEMQDRDYMAIPGMIGYVVKESDTLWSIAKKSHTTCEKIKSINKLTSDKVNCGDKLLLIKESR